ncbi:DUF2617 family protein [Rhodococcus sp. NPDC058521]|uniref:DUF2617 family protein n=1 Tax=Rhodococcus sp. NPDC058521 TaxID=3346536 RepID=UPI0036603CE8
MTVHVLDVAPRDVEAASLGLVVDAEVPPTLVELCIEDGSAGVRLGVLGASHVVSAYVDGAAVSEQVSCDAIGFGGRALPAEESFGNYRFESETVRAGRIEFDECARWVRSNASDDTSWICAEFPGARTALTALTAERASRGWSWRTWHLYPNDKGGEIVTTRSRWEP